ncbi:hypothetical protein BpHYR1_003164 [Brachionus plicatilis]|uniref:Uncharacterized protein n=1 Tax=Brachionus plicatilis TaxID=10195 RepID=A0A3M7SL42_BRAPC|nr:hypothetical protein BpHYR1_003164 [Brachionus plicatilis]
MYFWQKIFVSDFNQNGAIGIKITKNLCSGKIILNLIEPYKIDLKKKFFFLFVDSEKILPASPKIISFCSRNILKKIMRTVFIVCWHVEI